MKDFFTEKPLIKKVDKKRTKILSTIFLIVVFLAGICIIYISNLEFREWIDLYILQKKIEKNDAAIIEFDSEANAEICAYDKYIGILSKNKFEGNKPSFPHKP